MIIHQKYTMKSIWKLVYRNTSITVTLRRNCSKVKEIRNLNTLIKQDSGSLDLTKLGQCYHDLDSKFGKVKENESINAYLKQKMKQNCEFNNPVHAIRRRNAGRGLWSGFWQIQPDWTQTFIKHFSSSAIFLLKSLLNQTGWAILMHTSLVKPQFGSETYKWYTGVKETFTIEIFSHFN